MKNMTQSRELVSVVIPAYNCEQYIERCLYSLLNQTYSNLEIIVVNDGSTDATLNICKILENTDGRIHIIDKKNAGVATARNAGLKEIKGSLCTFVDSDDYVSKEFIQKMVNTIHMDGTDICVCGFVDEDENGTVYHQSKIENAEVYSVSELNKNNFFPYVCWQIMFKTDLLNKKNVIRFNENFDIKEDMLFINDLMLVAETVSVIPDILYHSVSRNGSLTDGLYAKGSWDKYKKSIFVYEIALNSAKKIPAVQKKVCYETLKEVIQMRKHMEFNDIHDDAIDLYLKKLKLLTLSYCKTHTWSMKESFVIFLMSCMPKLYLWIKS